MDKRKAESSSEKPLPILSNEEDLDATPAYDDVVLLNEGTSQTVSDSAKGHEKHLPSKEKEKELPEEPESEDDHSEDEFSEESGSSSSSGSSSQTPSLINTPIQLQQGPTKITQVSLPPSSQINVKISTKTQADALATVRASIRNLLQREMTLDESYGIVLSCASTCHSNRLDFSCILQERSIEGHSPIFWAILSRYNSFRNLSFMPHNLVEQTKQFLIWFLSHVTQMTVVGRAELRSVALVVADNDLLQRLHALPGVNQLSGIERVLLIDLARSVAWKDKKDERTDNERADLQNERPTQVVHSFGDVAEVKESSLGSGKDTGLFNVSLAITMFQRRMRVSREISIEFIAKGRLWILAFFVVLSPVQTPNVLDSAAGLSPDDPLSSDPREVPPASIAAARFHGLAPGTWALSLSLFEDNAQCVAEATLSVHPPIQQLDNSQRSDSSPSLNSSHTSSTLPSRRHYRVNSELPPIVRHSSYLPAPIQHRSNDNTVSTRKSPQHQSSYPPHLLHPPFPSHARLSVSTESFSRRSMSSFNAQSSYSPLSILLSGTSSDRRPLLTAPPPSTLPQDDPSPLLPLKESKSSKKDKKKKIRISKKEKQERKKAAAKERRAADGKESKRDKEENEKAADSVLFASLNGTLVRGTKDKKKKDQKGKEKDTNGSPIYDLCNYIGPDGILRADLEVRLYGSELSEKKGSECVIC